MPQIQITKTDEEWEALISAPHGLYTTYNRSLCRCTRCRAAKTAQNAIYRTSREVEHPGVGWLADAICAGVNPDVFFPTTTEDVALSEAEARSYCVRCPVKDACRDYAISTREEMGVWGGMNFKERDTYMKRRRRERVSQLTPSQSSSRVGV